MRIRMIVGRSLSLLATLSLPATVRAQAAPAAPDSVGPRAGTWGAELGIGSGQSATLLRFRSPRSAVLLGADVLWLDVSEDLPQLNGTQTERYTVTNVEARVGMRRYGATGTSARPFSSVGIVAGYFHDRGGPGWTAGAFGELGASYFFTPHVSLGAAGGLQAVYTSVRRRSLGGPSLGYRQVRIRASAVQLLGAVYF